MEGAEKTHGHTSRIKKVVAVSARVCVEANDYRHRNHVFFLINKVIRNFLKAACRKWLVLFFFLNLSA